MFMLFATKSTSRSLSLLERASEFLEPLAPPWGREYPWLCGGHCDSELVFMISDPGGYDLWGRGRS
jgi:hypothetical protein